MICGHVERPLAQRRVETYIYPRSSRITDTTGPPTSPDVSLQPDRRDAPRYAPDASRESRDRAWVERIRTGDVPAFEAMFRAYKNDLGAFVTSWVHSREAADEVIQDLFLHLWEQRHEWEPVVPLNIYLFRAARNRAIDYLRHQRVEASFQERIARRHGQITSIKRLE